MSASVAGQLAPWQRFFAQGLLVALAVPYLLPLVWMVSTSLKSDRQIFPREGGSTSPVSLENLIPDPIEWKNYPEAMKTVPFALYLRNTLMVLLAGAPQ